MSHYDDVKALSDAAIAHLQANRAARWYVCTDCGLDYKLSAARIKKDNPARESFTCDICEDGE
jgi:hypothetical protein